MQSSRRISGELNHYPFALARFFSKLLAQFEAEMVFHWNMPGWAAMKSAEKHLGMAALNLPASFAIRAP